MTARRQWDRIAAGICGAIVACAAGPAGAAASAAAHTDGAGAAAASTPGAPAAPALPAPSARESLPSFAALEAAGATIGEIRISTREIFDTADPREDNALFRLANRLHVRTRPDVIARALLFKSGERVDVQVIEETERILRASRYLYDVRIRPFAVHEGVVDIEVLTRDTWSLDPGLSVSRQGGADSSGVKLAEYNLLGTGVALSVGRSRNVDRSSSEFALSNPRAFGSWTALRLAHADSSDGSSNAVSVVRPFYRLDARWAAGVSASDDDAIDAVYARGTAVGQYRHRERRAEVFGGLSPGLVDGWVHRVSLGVSLREDRYAVAPGLTAPAPLPADQHLVAPFVRLERLEDRFERKLNRNLIGQPEYFSLGLSSTLQLGWATPAFGSRQAGALYSLSVARGFEYRPDASDQLLMTAAQLAGQRVGGRVERQRLGAQMQYYLRQSSHRLFYAAASADVLTRPALEDLLLLGGDNGLRGYPLRYQSGTRRVLLTVEQRFYTDLYVWRLFRIGGAAYLDAGRAWGGGDVQGDRPWLGNVGLGLRIVSMRSAFSNVLHLDVALPLRAPPDVRRVQFLVKTRTSF